MAKLLNKAEKMRAWPWQILCSLVSLIPKGAGGERPIYLQCMLNRIWAQLRKESVQEWCMEEARFRDTAVKGSSALRASVMRLVKDECAAVADAAYATILWEVGKFYDNMTMTGLAQAS